jgi:hypothetical protein
VSFATRGALLARNGKKNAALRAGWGGNPGARAATRGKCRAAHQLGGRTSTRAARSNVTPFEPLSKEKCAQRARRYPPRRTLTTHWGTRTDLETVPTGIVRSALPPAKKGLLACNDPVVRLARNLSLKVSCIHASTFVWDATGSPAEPPNRATGVSVVWRVPVLRVRKPRRFVRVLWPAPVNWKD